MKIFTILSFLFSSLFFSTISFAESKSETTTIEVQKQVVQVNINNATSEELTKGLTGIGISKAQKIIEYREKFGPFISIEQLKEVSGIGQATLDKNIGKITL